MLYIIYILAGWKAIEILIKTFKELKQAIKLYVIWKKQQIEKNKRCKIIK